MKVLAAIRNALIEYAARRLLRQMDDDEVTKVRLPRWTPVHSVRGKFVHMAHDGSHTLCGVRLKTIVGVPDMEVDCLECHRALTFN